MFKSAIYFSMITRSFLVYSFAGDTVEGSCEHKQKNLFVNLASSMHYTTSNQVINMKTYCRRCVGRMPILLLVWKINAWKIGTTMQHIFPVWQCMLGWCI